MQDIGQIARKHHYVPQFYLRAWQSIDGKGLWLYSRNKKNCIKVRRRSPKSVGYMADLYSLKPETPYAGLNPRPDAIETGFFALLDEAAASVHQKLLASGVRNLTTTERLNWALFLNSLIERNPTRIEEIEQSLLAEDIQDECRQRFGQVFLDKIDFNSMQRNSVRRALVDYICDRSFVDYVAEMRWATIDITVDGEHLITGDRPLLVNAASAGYPVHCLSIALSPRRLMILHANAQEFDEDFIRTLAALHNIAIVQQTERHLISSQELRDGPHTKYSRVVRELMKPL